MPKERLHKVLAQAGVAARRKAEQLIREGRISVNDAIITEMGVEVDPRRDTIRIDGTTIAAWNKEPRVYLLLYKPTGVVSTTSDEKGRRTVLDLVPAFKHQRLVLVGRLDYHSEGVILLTNDGDLVHTLTHPSSGVARTYHAKVRGRPTEASLNRLREGIKLEDGVTRPAHVEIVGPARTNTWVEITITEGRNRQVRRMFRRIRHQVQRLRRVQFAGLTLDGLRVGEARELSSTEVLGLRAYAAPTARPAKPRPPRRQPAGQATAAKSKRPAGQAGAAQNKRPADRTTEAKSKRPAGQAGAAQNKRPAGRATEAKSKRPAGQSKASTTKHPAGRAAEAKSKRSAGQAGSARNKRPAGRATEAKSKRPAGQAGAARNRRSAGQAKASRTKRPAGQSKASTTKRPAGQAKVARNKRPK